MFFKYPQEEALDLFNAKIEGMKIREKALAELEKAKSLILKLEKQVKNIDVKINGFVSENLIKK